MYVQYLINVKLCKIPSGTISILQKGGTRRKEISKQRVNDRSRSWASASGNAKPPELLLTQLPSAYSVLSSLLLNFSTGMPRDINEQRAVLRSQGNLVEAGEAWVPGPVASSHKWLHLFNPMLQTNKVDVKTFGKHSILVFCHPVHVMFQSHSCIIH